MLAALTFLAPWALAGSLLLAIPILVHLFKPRKVRQTPFSSLRWLHLTQQRLSRRIQWHQVFLFLLRATLILLLVFALARPIYHAGESAGVAERFIILDVSRSMSYQPPDRLTPFEMGKKAAVDLLKRQGGEDRTALLLTGSTTKVLQPLTQDASSALTVLETMKCGYTDTDLGSALRALRPMLSQARSGAGVEVFFITDNQQRGWNQGEIAAFLKDQVQLIKVKVVDVGVESPQNAWIADARLVSGGERRLLRVQLACVGDLVQERTVRLAGMEGIPERTQEVTIEQGQLCQVEFEISTGYDVTDKSAHISLEPADGLPSDDHLYLNLDTKGSLKVLVVEGGKTEVESLRPGLHLRTALEALASSTRASMEVAGRPAAEVTAREITEADLIFFADVPELAESNAAALETRIKGGAGLVIFLGPAVKTAFYNSRFFQPQNPGEGLLPMALKSEKDIKSGNGESLSRVRWQHPMLAGLFDPVLGDLIQARFRSFFQFEKPVAEPDVVLGWIGDAVPALVEHDLGAGKVFLFNTTANDEWSDLPRRKSFVPMIDRLLAYLSRGGMRRSFDVGEKMALAVPRAEAGEKVTVVGPEGTAQTVLLKKAGGQALLELEGADQPGIYRVNREGGALLTFEVQVGKGDSVLRPADPATLAAWWQPANFEVVKPEVLLNQMKTSETRLALWPWLILAAGIVFLAEMFFVHWLCPRVNPHVVSSVIHQGRILTRLGEKEGT